jgi:hypothetical protein
MLVLFGCAEALEPTRRKEEKHKLTLYRDRIDDYPEPTQPLFFVLIKKREEE